MWFLLALLALHFQLLGPQFANIGLVIIATLIFFFGGIVNPSWVALMGDIVPEHKRASWFGYRYRITSFVGLITLLLAGWFLNWMKPSILVGFAILFAISFIARLGSAYFLALHWDPNQEPKKEREPSNEAANYSLLLFLLFFTINMSVNFLPVYLLSMLKFDYVSFSSALIASTLFFTIAAPHWGRLIEKYGTKKVLVASVALNSLSSFIILLVHDPISAIAAYSFAGILWAGIVGSSFNYLYDITQPDERIKASGHAYLLSGAGTFFGTFIGGFTLSYFGSQSIFSFYVLFLLTALLRIISALIINAYTREVKNPPSKRSTIELIICILTIYPFKGFTNEIREHTTNFISKIRKTLIKTKRLSER